MKASERTMLIEHIMDPTMPNNLGVAVDTADVMYDVRKQILGAGASALVDQVIMSDPTGKLLCVEDSLTSDPMARYTGLSFRNEDWPDDHMVAIEAQSGQAASFIIGVFTGRRPLDERLGGTLKAFHAGTGNELWPWYYSVAAPYDRWTSKTALFGFRSGDAVTELASQLTAVVAILDRYSSSIATA